MNSYFLRKLENLLKSRLQRVIITYVNRENLQGRVKVPTGGKAHELCRISAGNTTYVHRLREADYHELSYPKGV